jgi:hypothetical protein
VREDDLKPFERLTLIASAIYLVSLFFPWDRARFPGTLHGWDDLLGVVSGVVALAVFLAMHAHSIGQLGPLVPPYLAFALVFFTAARLINNDVVSKAGYAPGWGAYLGIVAACVTLVMSLVVLAGGWRAFVDRLPDPLRIDRL